MRPVTLLLLVALLTSGCAVVSAVPTLAVVGDAISNAFAIYQRREARKSQDEQTAEIKALREEVARLRGDGRPAYLCFGVILDGVPATLCGPEAPK